MRPSKLSPIYLNNRPVDLPADPKPEVSKIMAAGGQAADQEVHWLTSRDDPLGQVLRPGSVVDRTAEPTQPIYLATRNEAGATPPYAPRDYGRLIGTPGFSEKLLCTHFKLYEGYVKHTNTCIELLGAGTLDPFAAGEVRRRQGWEFNGMRLHELYFDGMLNGGRELAKDAELHEALGREFGSFEAWWTQFQAIGATRGIGWGVLQHDPVADRLINTWINEHDAGALAGTHPVLVLDLFEHAYMRDYDTDRTGYLKAFAGAIDWAACERRWERSKATMG